MKIKREYKIESACEDAKTGSRPVLQAVSVQRTRGLDGVVVAANGYSLARVPVTMEPRETDRLIPGQAIRQCRQHSKRRG